MKQDLQEKLYDNYPYLFSHLEEDLPRHEQYSIRRFGPSCDDGWFDIINRLCADLEALILELPEDERQQYAILDIKEKFGFMSFYMRKATRPMHDLIRKACEETMVVCEKCGAPGTKENNFGWIKTYCRGHHDARKEERRLLMALAELEYFAALGEKLEGSEGHVTNLVEIWKEEDDPERPGQKRKVLEEKVKLDTKRLMTAYDALRRIRGTYDEGRDTESILRRWNSDIRGASESSGDASEE
jgi:hypothetical protein